MGKITQAGMGKLAHVPKKAISDTHGQTSEGDRAMTVHALKSNPSNSRGMKGSRSRLLWNVSQTSVGCREKLKATIARLMGIKDVLPGRWYL